MVDQDAMATEVVALIDGLALQTFAELDGNVHPHQQEGTERGHNPRVPGLPVRLLELFPSEEQLP